MNVLLIIGLVLFACAVVWVYVLFMASSIKDVKKQVVEVEDDTEDILEHCNKLYDQGLHAELQRYAQRKLSNQFNNVELRRILAKSLWETDNEKMAIMHYEAILKISPKDFETLDFLASYYCEHGPRARAIDLYEKIYAYDPGNINSVETLAKLYEESGNWEKAIKMYGLMLDAEIDGNAVNELKCNLAELYIKTGNNAKAFETYEEIYRNDTENLEIIMILADLAYKNRYWQDCLKYYQKIASIVGDDFEILEKIAQLYVTLEDWDKAIEAYKKLIALEDKNSSNYLYHQNELCNALLKNEKGNEVITILKDLIGKYPKETSFTFTLAQAYTSVGDFQTALNMYQKLLDSLPPEQGEIIINYISNLICSLAQDLFQKGEYNQAFDKFFEALKYNEENDDIYYQLGKCNYYIKSIQDAISHFKHAISIKPQESRYYYALGCAYDEMDSIKSAKNAFYDAINIDPMNIQARIAYAISLTKELEYAQSINQFLEVLKYIPDNADTLYNVALAYELIGDIERAIKYYKEAIDKQPNHKEANHNLELLIGEPYVPARPISVNNSDSSDDSEIIDVQPDETLQNANQDAIDDDFNFDVPQDGNNQDSMFS